MSFIKLSLSFENRPGNKEFLSLVNPIIENDVTVPATQAGEWLNIQWIVCDDSNNCLQHDQKLKYNVPISLFRNIFGITGVN